MSEAIANKQLFFQLEKWDQFSGLASGIATAEQVDRDREILDYRKSKPYFEAWSESVHKDSDGHSFGNVRLQHDDKKVAGKLTDIEFNDDARMIRVTAQIVDPVAKDLLQTRCLTGFSIGGRYVDKSAEKDGTTRYVADPCEISVVDRPALPSAVFQSVKADGNIELCKFAKYEDDESAEKGTRYLVPEGQHLPVSDESGKPSHSHMGAAWAALHGGYRGNKYEGPGRDKAIAALTALYHSEGMELPSAEKSISDRLDLADAIDLIASLDIEKASESVLGLLKSLDEVLEKKMPEDKEKDVLELDKAARHSVHQKIAAAKEHVSNFMANCQKAGEKMHGHLDGIAKCVGMPAGEKAVKVDGGGPEVLDEHGKPDEVEEGEGEKDSFDESGLGPKAGIADKGGKVQFVKIGTSADGVDIYKKVEPDKPLTKSELVKTIIETMTALEGAKSAVTGDRSRVVPFVKANVVDKADDGKAGDKGDDGVEKMSDEDWKKYGQGDSKAIAKAQRCTATKWQATPSRLADPDRYRGAMPAARAAK